MGALNARRSLELLSGSESIFFIENRPLREYFLLSARKMPSISEKSEIEGILSLELFLQSIKLLPNPLVLIVSVRVESDALCAVLLLSSL